MSYKEIWDKRYSEGGNSGRGSYGEHYEFKTKVINGFIEKYNIKNVVDFGCGDGNQISNLLFEKYHGVDLSEVSVGLCRSLYADDATKSFGLYELGKKPEKKAELTMSLDVIYHLIDDSYFEDYMKCLIECTDKYILVYSTNFKDDTWEGHVRHREFDNMLQDEFERIEFIKNELDCPADFYFYQKRQK